ncbi:hypothetical protein [Hymenobacter terrenus]|uniref:hypothetical protein n=1 Tax=Hymenobacter terrenus TaxID=1629124 RepID=UPI000619C6C7|nr:hypothetical protein [Hymenobacter terrenus]
MKTEWDLFADVHKRLTEGEELITYYFVDRPTFPPDSQTGRVLDEQGTEYELGEDYKQALEECIRARHISWNIRFPERTISFGPGLNKRSNREKVTLTISPDFDIIIKSD